jgi:hypothetical protein
MIAGKPPPPGFLEAKQFASIYTTYQDYLKTLANGFNTHILIFDGTTKKVWDFFIVIAPYFVRV